MFNMVSHYSCAVHLVFFVVLVLDITSALTEKYPSKNQEVIKKKENSPVILDHESFGSDNFFVTEAIKDLARNEGTTTTKHVHNEDVLKSSQNAKTVLQSEYLDKEKTNTKEGLNTYLKDNTQKIEKSDVKHTTLTVKYYDQLDITKGISSLFTNSYSSEKEKQSFDESISPDENANVEDIKSSENRYLKGFNSEKLGDSNNEHTSADHGNVDHISHIFLTTPSSGNIVGPSYSVLALLSTPESVVENDSKSTINPTFEEFSSVNSNNISDDGIDLTDATTDSVLQTELLNEQNEILKKNQHTVFNHLEEQPIVYKQLEGEKQLKPIEFATVLSQTENPRSSELLPLPEKLYGFNQERYDPIGNSIKGSEEKGQSLSKSQYIQPSNKHDNKSKADDEYIGNALHHTSNHKVKIESGILFEDCSDCDIRILPIKPLEQRSTAEAEVKSLPSSKITFADLPEGRELQINSLGLSDGIFLFSYISEFLSWIQPNDFPVELLKEALKNQMSWINLITQSLQVEAGFVVCLVVGVLLALAVPVVVLSHACYRMGGRLEDQAEDNGGWAGNCRRRTLVFLLQLLLVLLCAGMVAMFVTNEQLSSAVVQSREVVETALNDVSTFVHSSHLQLHFLLTQSLDQMLQAVYADLDNVDTLLGRPIQRELVRETGLDVALDTLSDMTREAKSVTQQVERFMEEVRTTQELLMSSRDKLTDLRQQVELFRRACGPRDRTMCDTIDASGLEVTLKLDRIKTDERLNRMRRMGGVGLEVAAAEAKDHFLTIPSRVEAETRDAREDVRRMLTRQRAEVDEHTLALERLARDLTSKVGEARFQAGYWTQDLDQLEYWRWIVCMGGGAAVLMIWMLLLCSMCCGCCGSEKAAGPTILVTIVLMCLFSTALWTLVMVGLLVGGHTEVFLCRPLYDEPEFHVLSRLVDKPGVFYDQPAGGFIGNVIYGNDTIDVPVTQVLKDCQESRPVYPALGLHRVMDVASAVGRGSWGDVTAHLRSIKANLSHLEVLSPALTDQLGDLLATLSVNFTEHRIQMSRPVTGKDLDSFAKQLDNIGNQLRDLATASRMETLSSRTRRLIDSHIRPLEGRKDALVYQLTALEVQTQPLQRQVNQSLSHLKTIQFFINSQGQTISEKKSQEYIERLLSYLEQLRDHVIRSARETVAPCRPIWDIFNNSRLFLCHHIVDPLNGFWFATMWCLLVLLVATPVCLKLVDYYRAQGVRSSGSPSETLVSSEQGGGWSTPGYDIKCSKNHNGGCE